VKSIGEAMARKRAKGLYNKSGRGRRRKKKKKKKKNVEKFIRKDME
jgi:hypothetical protein